MSITMSIMNKDNQQKGIVSLLMTLVMMIVITLLVLGFAEIARNEQRSSLDDQLSAQAYYAAESAINDARAVMSTAITTGGTAQDKTICGAQGSYTTSGTVDAMHNVAYTCLLVNASPTTLNYTLSSTSTVVPIISTGAPFTGLTFSWKVGAGYAGSAAGCYVNIANLNTLPAASGASAWSCNYPIARADIFDANGVLARPSWSSQTSTIFLIPFNSNAVNNTVALGAHGTAVPARCDSTSCQVNLNGLNGTKYYLRLTALYRTNSSFSIVANGNIPFADAQATIDATGKAQDVLRRILVAVDLTDANAHHIPSGAIISQDSICKRFGSTNGSLDIYDDMSAGSGGNSICSLQSIGTPIP
jgi:Tfp pilus assembly protein PilX